MKTRAQLLAQLEAEQATGDPGWGNPDDLFTRLIHALAEPLLEQDNPTVIRLHRHRTQRTAA